MKGQLLLLPNLLNKEAPSELFLPTSVDRAVAKIDGLIAENEKEGRAYLKRFSFDRDRTFRDIPIQLFNKHHQEVDELLIPLRKGEIWGLVSDAGLPVIADPGYRLVHRARELGIVVKAFVGPSSILLSLMLSGLPAQTFTFHGYCPKELKMLEEGVTHLFIEAPFRNTSCLKKLLAFLPGTAQLCLAWDLTCPTQGVETHSVDVWKKRTFPAIDKRPCVFLVHINAIPKK